MLGTRKGVRVPNFFGRRFEVFVSKSKERISKKIFFILYFLTLLILSGAIFFLHVPLHVINIMLLPFLVAIFWYKDRSYLILLVPTAIDVVYLSYLFAPSFKLSMLSLTMVAIAVTAFAELVIKYFKKLGEYEVKLKRSKDQFEQLLNYTYDWEYWIKPDGTLGYSSPSCLPQTGYSNTEFLENKDLLWEIVHPDDKEIVKAHFERLHSDEPFKFEFRIIKKNGKLKVIRHTCQPVYDSDGKFIGRRATNRNATDRWLAEQRLKESEEKFRNIFNSLVDVYYRTKLDGTIELISPSIERIAGYKPSELIGKDATIFYKRKEDREKFLETILEQGYLRNYRVELTDRKGVYKIFSFNTKLIKDSKGNPIAIEGVFRDVTELIEKEKALKKAHDEARRYLNVANVLMVILDREGKVKLINEKGAEILKVKQDEIIGKNFFELFSLPENVEKQKLRHAQIMNGEIELKKDVETVVKVGNEEKIISWHSTLLKDDDGNIVGLLSSAIDVTKERKLQEELEKEKNKYLTLFKSNIAAVFLSDLEGNILEANDAFAKLFGYDSNQKTNLFDLYAEKFEREKFIEKIRQEKAIVSNEQMMRRKDGETLWILENLTLIEDQYIQGTMVDITKRKEIENKLRESEKELRELNKSKDRLLSIIAHDIRSPFTALLGYSQLLMEEYQHATKEELGSYIKALDRTSRNIFKFIDELLAWTRAQSGRIEINETDSNLYSEVESVVLLNQENAERKGIEIKNRVDKTIVVRTDENVLNTVLRNLISNAVKFTQKGGIISIDAQIKGNEVIVTVEDTGVGIEKENLEKLFRIDSYFTTQGTAKESGTGLGLLLCKELIEKQGGRIWVESEIEKGSKFSFSLSVSKGNSK